MKAWIGLGSNLEDSLQHLSQALNELNAISGVKVLRQSKFYRTAPVGYLDQPDFINAVAELETQLAPEALLDVLLKVESLHGRNRSFQNAPRTLDLDLLLYGDQIIKTARLEVPHPRMHERAFVLMPLNELEPDLLIPRQGKVSALANACSHQAITPLTN